MNKAECSCASLERLEGASVPAYIHTFLDQMGYAGADKKVYRCRVCGREWEKRSSQTKSEGTRPSLIRLEDKV
ncbi:MAG: hypothetical protein H0W99_02565 [Acidobacteria bacterium]|nr:hypothetical protein [Acidobacteriota bacterium]